MIFIPGVKHQIGATTLKKYEMKTMSKEVKEYFGYLWGDIPELTKLLEECENIDKRRTRTDRDFALLYLKGVFKFLGEAKSEFTRIKGVYEVKKEILEKLHPIAAIETILKEIELLKEYFIYDVRILDAEVTKKKVKTEYGSDDIDIGIILRFIKDKQHIVTIHHDLRTNTLYESPDTILCYDEDKGFSYYSQCRNWRNKDKTYCSKTDILEYLKNTNDYVQDSSDREYISILFKTE